MSAIWIDPIATLGTWVKVLTSRGAPIAPVAGRIPSARLGLHLERDGATLRLFDPVIGNWLPTRKEALDEAKEALDEADAEIECLRREVEELRRRLNP